MSENVVKTVQGRAFATPRWVKAAGYGVGWAARRWPLGVVIILIAAALVLLPTCIVTVACASGADCGPVCGPSIAQDMGWVP